MSGITILWLGAATGIFVGAAAALRAYVALGQLSLILLSLALYAIGNLLMVRVMRESGMAVAVSVSAVLQLLLATLVAVTVFAERPTPLQWGGIALGLAAVAMIVWPAGRAG
jgi:glucose uptake protein